MVPAYPRDPTPTDLTAGMPQSSTEIADAKTQADAQSLGEGPGTTIGPYKIVRLIGEGGFGSVFMAEQTKPVQRKVALKIIKLGMDTKNVIARFEQERQALALMEHPNIAKVLDAGATDTGRPYFVMELCTGDSITDYCDEKKLSIPQRLDLFVQVCQAVQHAHQKGLIHRDIKPSNILVATEDGEPHARVIDFGIAKATISGNKLTDKTLVTQHLQIVGTPHYMSPEQAEGSLDIDTRTDIYSLGVLLYELLTGTTPFDSRALHEGAFADLPRIIREVEAPRPSARLRSMIASRASLAPSSPSTPTVMYLAAALAPPVAGWSVDRIAAHRRTEPKRLTAMIRGELDWIVMKAMEKDRTRRYETANGFASDIRRYLNNETVSAGPPSKSYRMRKFIKRNRVMVSAGAAVAAALLIGVAAFAWQAKLERDQRDLAVKAQNSEAEQRKTAEEQREVARVAADAAERAAYQAQMVSAANAVEGQRIDAATALLAATSPRLRGWEYRHLVSRLDRSLPSPFPADWLITGLATSEASTRVAVRRSLAGGSGPVEWVVLDGDLRTERLIAPNTEIPTFALSPDGTRAVWAPWKAGDRRPAVLWNIDTKAVLATFPTLHSARANFNVYVSWSTTGDRFAISYVDGFQMHDGRTGALLDQRDVAGNARFTGDDRWMILQGSQRGSDFGIRELQLLDSRTFEPQGDAFQLGTPAGQISFWQSRVACAVQDGTMLVFEIVDGTLRERSRFPAGINNFNIPAWSPDGRMVALGSTAGGRIRVWDAESGTARGDFGGPQSSVAFEWFLPESGDLWACNLSGQHRVWPMNIGSLGVLTAHRSYVYPVTVSKDGDLLLTAGWDGFVGQSGGLKCWDAHTGALVCEYGRPGEIFKSAGLTPDGRHVVAGIETDDESNRRTEVIDLTTGIVATTFRPQAKFAHSVCTIVFPDGKRVISTYISGEAYVWDLFTGRVLWETDQRTQANTLVTSAAAAVSPDGRLIALGDRQTGIRLVKADTYADIRRWDAHKEGMLSMSFSPDGNWLLSASNDQTIGVWDVASGTLVARLAGHGAAVYCTAMSPDGTRIASGGRDGYLRLWDTKSFQNVAQLGGHKDYIYSLAWSPDGRQIYTGSGDSTVRIWDTHTFAEQIAAAQERRDAVPGLEARIAKARNEAVKANSDVLAAQNQAASSPELTPRQREIARQVVTRFAFHGMPSYYRAPKATTAIILDGKIDEAEWSSAPWSEPFVDIEGDIKPKPRFETKMRIMWDDTNLYIAAHLEEPQVSATLKNRDDFVCKENDFEVFVDPEGDSRYYGEVEVNALGTIFDLRLDKPYNEGGPPHHEWSPAGMRAAVAVDGTLNDPSDTDRGWTVEIAIPLSSLADHATVPIPPRPGDVWRINFSRVEYQYDVVNGKYVQHEGTREDNWVWTPQHVVNMHVPGEWGFVEFVQDSR